jgi:protein-disulfide isomerase
MQQQLEQNLAEQAATMKRQTAMRMADDYLIEEAAKKANLSPFEYLKKAVADSAISDAQARQFYDQRGMAKIGSFELMKPRIVNVLTRNAVVARLRQNEQVRILLEPKREKLDSSGHPALGPSSAPVTIVEFSDFQCPFCRAAEPTLKELRSRYGDKIRIVYMDYPLPFHNHSMDAARAARCAGEQGKFWPYHDALFADQKKLAPDELKATAQTVGLDGPKFSACLDQSKYIDQVNKDEAAGKQVGVQGTPSFFVNGRFISGAQKPEAFEEIIDEELANSGPQSARAAR